MKTYWYVRQSCFFNLGLLASIIDINMQKFSWRWVSKENLFLRHFVCLCLFGTVFQKYCHIWKYQSWYSSLILYLETITSKYWTEMYFACRSYVCDLQTWFTRSYSVIPFNATIFMMIICGYNHVVYGSHK